MSGSRASRTPTRCAIQRLTNASTRLAISLRGLRPFAQIFVAGNHDLVLDAAKYEETWSQFHKKKFGALCSCKAIMMSACYLRFASRRHGCGAHIHS